MRFCSLCLFCTFWFCGEVKTPAIADPSRFGQPPPRLSASTKRWTEPGCRLSPSWPESLLYLSDSEVWPVLSGLQTPPRCGSSCLGWNAPGGRGSSWSLDIHMQSRRHLKAVKVLSPRSVEMQKNRKSSKQLMYSFAFLTQLYYYRFSTVSCVFSSSLYILLVCLLFYFFPFLLL